MSLIREIRKEKNMCDLCRICVFAKVRQLSHFRQIMKPNSTELTILKLLWQNQPRTGKDIHAALSKRFGWGYSSTRKTLERMSAKGLLSEEMQGNKKTYNAQLEKMPTLALLAQDFAKQIMEIDSPLPVAMFADSKLMSPEELAELESLLSSFSNQDKDIGEVN